MQYLLYILAAYLVIINVIGFASMGIDKKKAIRHAYRTPEATLFLYAFLGGAIGSSLGMHHFRHKTKHWYFVVGMPAIAVIEYGLLLWALFKLFFF